MYNLRISFLILFCAPPPGLGGEFKEQAPWTENKIYGFLVGICGERVLATSIALRHA